MKMEMRIFSDVCSLMIIVITLYVQFSNGLYEVNMEKEKHECDGDHHQNLSSEWVTKAVPYVNGKISKCDRFVAISMNNSDDSICPWTFNQSDVIKCARFVYLTDDRMLLNEFNLTCQSNEWKLGLVGSMGYFAECLALPIVGLIADKYGRQPTLIYSVAIIAVIGIAKSFSSNYKNFMILHFIGALFSAGAFGQAFVMGSEVVGTTSRGFGIGIIANAISVGQILLAIVTMFIRDFRVLLRFLFGLLAFASLFIWLMPESPRWLFTVGKHKKGLKILKDVAKLNGTKIPDATLTLLLKNNEYGVLLEENNNRKIEKYPIAAAFKSKVLFARLINCCFCYFTNGLIYFGLSVYSSILPGDKHMNLIYAAIAEIPGNAATYFVLQRYGRKWSLVTSMLLCSMACVTSEILPSPVMKIIFFLLGKFSICLSYTILNIYSIELFPTHLRQSLFNICLLFGGFGNVLAPMMPLLSQFMPSLPLILFGGTSFSSALLVLFLPETRNKNLPDTVEEAINI